MMSTELAPICLFTFNRLDETQQTIEALKSNNLAKWSNLYIFSDGPKDSVESKIKVNNVRAYLTTITGFKKIDIIRSNENKGLANSVIQGVNHVFDKYNTIIVLEDDLVTSPNFLDFMNQSLQFYKKHQNIFSVSGYTMDLPSLSSLKNDVYFGYRASSWGWATWKDRWVPVDWEVKDYDEFSKNSSQRNKFLRGGSDMNRMLKKQMLGEIDSWAIRWCYHQFKYELYTVYPKVSKLISTGFNENATHTKKTKRFTTILDISNRNQFSFQDKDFVDRTMIKEFKAKFSILNRLMDRF